MWIYEKKLQCPVNIKKTDAKLAKMILAQIGGPDGELGASMRYLNQRFAAPYDKTKAILTDIGTEGTCSYGNFISNNIPAYKRSYT